ncbi:MAG: hypothetical protein AB7S38_17920 [Vulcanimicrobiota bacterium]
MKHVLVAFTLSSLTALAMAWAYHQEEVADLDICKLNLAELRTQIEMYSTDWSGHYPPNLALLTPNYFKTLPTCPTTRTAGYALDPGDVPWDLTIVCQGAHEAHFRAPPGCTLGADEPFDPYR